MARTMIVNITVAARETGIWCEKCLLPSKAEFGLYWIRESGVTSMGSLIRCVTEGCR